MKWIKGYTEHIRESEGSSDRDKEAEKMFNSVVYKPYYAPAPEDLQKILDQGYDPNWVNEDGKTLLGVIILKLAGYYIPLIEKLLEAGADPNKGFKLDPYLKGSQISPLGALLTKSPSTWTMQVLRLLVQAGADVNMAVDEYGTTPIMLAAFWGNVEIIKYLIESGSDAREKNRDGFNVLHYYFRPKSLPIPRSNSTVTALSSGSNANMSAIELLLKAGADPNWHLDHKGGPYVEYPIVLASTIDAVSLGEGIPKKKPPYIGNLEALLNAGADPNVDSISGWGYSHLGSPLLKWCEVGDPNGVKLLLEAGANPDIPNHNGKTPLWYCKNIQVLKELLKGGANPNTVDKNGYVLINHFINLNKKMFVKELINAGCDPEKAFKNIDSFLDFFEGKISWYKRGNREELERRFKANTIRKKLF